MYLCAYNGALQPTLRLLRAGEAEEGDQGRAQARIILSMQLKWINAMFLLGVAVYLIISRASTWYYGVLVVALCEAGGLLIRSILNLQPGSPKMLAAIATDLERRRRFYKAAGDSLRLQAVEDILARLRSLPVLRYSLR
jgi:hypothetical protein